MNMDRGFPKRYLSRLFSRLENQNRTTRKSRLAILPLEERLVPTAVPSPVANIDYKVDEGGNGVEDALVMLIGGEGESSGPEATDSEGFAHLVSTPTVTPGVAGTAFWGVDVVLPPGYDFFISKDFAMFSPYWNGVGVGNAVTLTVITNETPILPDCTPPGANLLPQSAPDNANAPTAGESASKAGVRYFDGVISPTYEDLSSASDDFFDSSEDPSWNDAGMPWGQTRSWSNQVVYSDFGVLSMDGYGRYVDGSGTGSLSLNQRLGRGWVNNMLPRLRFVGNDFFESGTSDAGIYFRKTGADTWAPPLNLQSTAVSDDGEITIADETGNKTVFYDNTATPANLRGQLKRYVAANGETTSVTDYTDNGDVAEIQRVRGDHVESWLYGYGTGSVMSKYMTGVSLRRSDDGGATWRDIRAVEYRYTSWTGLNSPANQIEAAIVHDGSLSDPALETKYYRYYSNGDANGYQSALKYEVSSESFDRLAAAYGVTIDTVDSLTDAQVAVYADGYFEYTTDHRVKKVVSQGTGCSVCSSGQGTYQYSYYTNPHYGQQDAPVDDPGRFGEWRIRTTETLPDGNQNIVYTNNLGRVILKVFVDGSNQKWETYTRFDSEGRVIWTADAAAVTGYDEQYADLLHRVNGNFEFLSDGAGEIREYHYGSVTTATESQAGDVLGYLKDTSRRHGEMGASELLGGKKYFSHTANGVTIHPLASETAYPEAPQPETTTDDFSSLDDWTLTGGTWQESDGVLSQSKATGTDLKAAVLNDHAWEADQEIVASVRADSWTPGIFVRAGVSVRANPLTGQGYGMMFFGTDQIQFVDEGVQWGNSYSFHWETGVWYRFRLQIQAGVLRGKVWEEGDTEPGSWMFTQSGWGSKPSGNPALNGGGEAVLGGSSTASFKDVQVSETSHPSLGSSQPTDDFSATADGWTLIGGAWTKGGGIFSQTNTDVGPPKIAVLTDRTWGTDQEIVTSLRVDSWVDGNNAWAGVSVRANSLTGLGYSLVFNGTDQVRFLDCGVQWGNTYSFDWETGVWYRFRLRIEDDVLYGKVWEVGDAEPG
ncbi:RHS repeat domain-containing protein [Zavarzinella formosa]|uniref:hypothetical protein n=1 Tax=Zavarzinella formosa TaxID=360055 RepID=UPI0002E3AF57|nr:hypothetical protein [Zavarzinella formosa]